jgi:hypothetical protein
VPHYTRKGEVYALGSKIDIKGCYVTNSDSFHGRARALCLFTCNSIIEEAMSLMKPAAIKEAIRGGKYQT